MGSSNMEEQQVPKRPLSRGSGAERALPWGPWPLGGQVTGYEGTGCHSWTLELSIWRGHREELPAWTGVFT